MKQNGWKVSKKSLDKEKVKKSILLLPVSSTVKMEIELIYQNMEKLTESIERIRLLTSIKGISVFTAIGIMSDVVDINRFPSTKKFSSYLRSAPEENSGCYLPYA